MKRKNLITEDIEKSMFDNKGSISKNLPKKLIPRHSENINNGKKYSYVKVNK